MFFKKEVEHKTAEEYRADVQAHRQAYKNQWKTFLRTGVFMLAALVAVLVLSVAWFFNNNRVSADGVKISAADGSFEIRSKGFKGVHDDVLQTIKGTDGFWYNIVNSMRTTSGTESSINWLLSENSNQNNYSAQDVTFDGTAVKREDFAIEPGSKGKLTFYLVPGSGGDLSVDLALSVTPYRVETGGTYSKVSNDHGGGDVYANQFLTGHILYFLKTMSSGTATYEWIKDETFHIDITDAEADKEYEYSIYWVWPQNLSQILLNTGDPYLNGQIIEFDDVDTSIRPLVIADMFSYPEKYFFSSLSGQPLTTSYDEIAAINDIHSESPDTTKYDVQKFVDLSSYYNQADQFIGRSISFVEVSLYVSGN